MSASYGEKQKLNKPRGIGNPGVGRWIAILNRVLKESLAWTVSCRQRHKEGEGMCHASILENRALSRRTASAKTLGQKHVMFLQE